MCPIRSLAAEQEFGLSLRFTFRQALGLDAGKGTRIRGLGFPWHSPRFLCPRRDGPQS